MSPLNIDYDQSTSDSLQDGLASGSAVRLPFEVPYFFLLMATVNFPRSALRSISADGRLFVMISSMPVSAGSHYSSPAAFSKSSAFGWL